MYLIPSLEPTELRLVNGPNRCAGRVEVLHHQQWGTVCDNHWDMEDAKVVCRQLDCGAPISAPGWAKFGRGYDPIWLEKVTCSGTEAVLSECEAQTWGVHNCHHGEDASVVCSGNPLPRSSCLSSGRPLLPLRHRRVFFRRQGDDNKVPAAKKRCEEDPITAASPIFPGSFSA